MKVQHYPGSAHMKEYYIRVVYFGCPGCFLHTVMPSPSSCLFLEVKGIPYVQEPREIGTHKNQWAGTGWLKSKQGTTSDRAIS